MSLCILFFQMFFIFSHKRSLSLREVEFIKNTLMKRCEAFGYNDSFQTLAILITFPPYFSGTEISLETPCCQVYNEFELVAWLVLQRIISLLCILLQLTFPIDIAEEADNLKWDLVTLDTNVG